MKIDSISLEWFRGSADKVSLETKGKSVVVYGPNGSGKSCIVDAVEYVTHDGKIGHLSHEYSGKRQEKGLTNIHAPSDKKAKTEIKLLDGSSLHVEIEKSGSSQISGTPTDSIQDWNYRRTVLRQDEVADFIKDRKSDKYSALLPLLGLDSLEVAAENLRQLARIVESQSNLRGNRALHQEALKKKAGAEINEPLETQMDRLHSRYCPEKTVTTDFSAKCQEVKDSLEKRIADSTSEQRRHIALQEIGAVLLKYELDEIRSANEKLASAFEPLIKEKLGVLQNTAIFIGKHGDGETVPCPACGRSIATELFRDHVRSEESRLGEIILIFDERKILIDSLLASIRLLQAAFRKNELTSWRDTLKSGPLSGNLAYLEDCNTQSLSNDCGEQNLNDLCENLVPIVAAAKELSSLAPPNSQQLANDKATVGISLEILVGSSVQEKVDAAEILLTFLKETEQSIRNEIRTKAERVIGSISTDIQRMWSILHPDVSIEGVCLFLPDSADKAIDIHLKFHGIEQDSPRLTLSEGYRNSLGLCIFLSMVKHEGRTDRPLFLDDVVVSLDRNHRGMIAELLEKEFVGYQILVFTHDREWYTELGHLLDSKRWQFRMLLPYDKPENGIRWSHKTTTFDEGRAHLETRPDSAGNDARKIMDVELAMIAEKLRIRVLYLRGEKNDKRLAHDFLERLVSAGKSCFEKKDGSSYVNNSEAIDVLERADKLILAWGNRSSHSFDVVKAEASKLIDACESAIEAFKCKSCSKPVWYAEAGNQELVQCECGEIRWRYGKEKS